MASIDYGVITFKNNKLLTNMEDGNKVRNGAWGEFVHYPTGVTFYRTSIKDNEDIDKAVIRLGMYEKMTMLRKKVLYSTINGLKIKTKEIYPQTFLSKFKDEKGDMYTVIHGYDVDFDDFYSNRRGEIITKEIKKIKDKM